MAEEDTLDTFVAPRYRKQRATPSSKETKARVNEAAQFAADMVIPQTPFDAGLMLIPGGKIARKAGAALMALDAGDAEAGPLTKLLKALKGSAQDSEALENAAKEQNMLQGFYRGYAGQNPDTAELFITPQKRVADFYAQKRSSQTGETPHAEMVLIDQLTGKQYGHSTLGTGANPPLTTMARKIKAEDVKGRTQLYGKGGAVKSAVKKIINLFDDGEEVALTAAQRAEAGRKAAELIKAQEQVKASEALGQLMEKGTKRTTTTQSDRTRVGGGNIGGAAFPAISQADPAYAGKVWGVMDEGTAARLKNLTDPDTAWTTMLGAANQLKSNPIVFDKLKRQFLTSMKEGNLPPELEARINHNLALTFGEGASIRDPKIWKQADTFEKRAAIAELLMGQGIAPSKGGVALGGEKSGRGVIFKPTEILKRETEPSLLHGEYGGDVPTYAAGPRLFKIEKESEYRPDLHPGFPTLLRGEDLGFSMKPTPTEVYLPDWHARFKKANPDRAPGYYDLSLGVKGEGLPSQEINDAYIRHLIREGYAEGGPVGYGVGGLAKLAKKVLDKSSDVGLKIKPPSDNVVTVRQSNFQYPKTIGNQTVSIDKISGGVRLSDPNEVKRVKALAKKIASPEGYISRIIVDHNNNVIEGQHRLEALRELGVKDVPVYKIEELADTMPVDKMEAAVQGVGAIHSDHVGQIVSHALEHISEEGIDGARQMNYGRFQKHYNAALDAIQSGASPVIDRDANLAKFLDQSKIPQRLYHGTGDDIKEFKNSKIGAMGPGTYLTESPQNASAYSTITNRKGSANQPNVMPVYVQAKNPFVISDVNKSNEELFKYFDPEGKLTDDEVIKKVLDAGYDSIYAKSTGEVNVLDPKKIKSAIGNQGTYDINDPDITKAHGGSVNMAEGGSVKAPAAIYDPNLIDEIVNSIDEPMGYAEGGTVTGPDFDFKEDPETLRLYKHAMKQFMPNQEDTISTVSTGVQGRVGGGNLSAGIDMNRMTKGQQDQLMKSIAASYNVDLGDVNLNARLEAPLDAKDVYVGMLNGSIPIGEGRAMLGVQGIKTPYGSDVLGYNAGYSGKVGSGKLNVNVNKPKRGKPSAQVQYQIPFADGGPVYMGKGGALTKLVKKMTAGSDVLPAAKKEIIQAPSIIIPSKVSNVKQAIRESKGNYGAKRVERAADEIKNLEKLYTEQALREAFGGDNAKALMSMNPNDFEKYASPISPSMSNPQPYRGYGSQFLDDSMKDMTLSEYIDNLSGVKGGFADVPYLLINKQEQGLPLTPFITGHEGRHRSRSLANKGEQGSLVQLLPRAELREPLPRRTQEEYIEALKKELEMTGNKVVPQRYQDSDAKSSSNIFSTNKDIIRPAVDLPDIYAKGGSVRMAQGGSVSAYDADLVDAIANQFM